MVLAQDIGCAAIAKPSVDMGLVSDDPNVDMDCAYKDAVRKYLESHDIKLFIDVHGLGGARRCFMDIGTNDGQNTGGNRCERRLQRVIVQHLGMGAATIDRYFRADKDAVMSKWVWDNFHIPSLELEIDGKCRWFEGDSLETSCKMYEGIRAFVEGVI